MSAYASYHDEEATVTEVDDSFHDDPDAPLIDDLSRLTLDESSQRQPRKGIPQSIHNTWTAVAEWTKGPDPPRIFVIQPFFPHIQEAPLTLLDRYAPKRKHRIFLWIVWFACWLFTFSLILRASSFSATVPGYGSPMRLGCLSKYWSEGNGCGLNGNECRPFSNATLAFRCPANCRRELVQSPHAVGDQEVVYKPLVVGGPAEHHPDNLFKNAIYRGDSYICASAVHAGIIDDAQGGCAALTLLGEQRHFSSSKRHGIRSVSFDSYFPHTFGFLSHSRASCRDLRWEALGVSVTFTVLLGLFTTSAGVFFWSTFIILFFQTALATDPPNLTNYYSLLSVAFGRFLPACFCGWVTYRYTVKRTLANLTAQIEKCILWLGPAWVGALNNKTFDKIPIQRLTPHDISAQPGAVPALITTVLILVAIAIGQAWSFRLEGRMRRYLALYSSFVAALLLMVAIPGLSLRIHHYILALLLLPGTSFQNRPSLLYQGVLVGLFVNGIARWGFDSILQTPTELLEGMQKGSILPSVSVTAAAVGNITFALGRLPVYDAKLKTRFDGLSALVNDVERFRTYADGKGNVTWNWERHGEDVEYFRFAYVAGSVAGDFTKAGKWLVNGDWVDTKKGPS